jgi:transposase InsO family protein
MREIIHRWNANFRIVGIEELKSVPGTPTSNPFIERVIGTTRREYLDQLIIFSSSVQNKLDHFQEHYNNHRGYKVFVCVHSEP